MNESMPEIAGESMDCSISQFVRSCRVHIRAEMDKLNPNNALIATLCNAVRLTREAERMAKAPIISPAREKQQ